MSPKKSIAEKIWPKVDIGGPNDCWPFIANRANGRGNIGLYVAGHHTSMYASKAAWVATHGDPGSQYVLHSCDNPLCCNPSHMYLGDHRRNMADMWERQRPRRPKGEANHKTNLTAEQVQAIYHDTRTHRVIAAQYEVCEATVSNIKTGKTWNHVTARLKE